MIVIATVWLGLALTLAVFAWSANRRWAALTLPVAAVLAAAAVWTPTGSPRPTRPPPGQYKVIGAKIEIDRAIYVLLDGEPPAYYALPYSTGAADQLQGALDAAEAGEGGVTLTIDGEGGGETYDGPPPISGQQQPKAGERPAFSF